VDTDSIKRIGVISDTHGLLRDEAVAALRDSQLIIHAGDIGSPDVLTRLGAIAPVHAVRGNNDRDEWARAIPETTAVEVGAFTIYVLHDLAELDIDPRAAQFSAVISGHSHKPRIDQRDNVLYLNPGSAGPRRFNLPIAVALLRVGRNGLEPEIVELRGTKSSAASSR
jgi:uncharacterized protein